MGFDLVLGVLGGGADQVFQDFHLGRIDGLGVDLDRTHVALAVEGDPDHAAAGLARHLRPLELGLQFGHARLHGLGLLHHLAEILHQLSSTCSGTSAESAAGWTSSARTASMVLPGNSDRAAWTSGWRAASALTASAAAAACCSRLSSPGSPEIETIQRRPVHSPRRWPSLLARLAGACGPGRNSIRPSSKCTRCTWRARLVLRMRSPSASASATTSAKLSGMGRGLGAALGSAMGVLVPPAAWATGAGEEATGWTVEAP